MPPLKELPRSGSRQQSFVGLSYTERGPTYLQAYKRPHQNPSTGREAPLPVSCRNCVKLGMSMT